MRIYLQNNPPKFHPDPIWKDRAAGFLRNLPSKKKKNNNNNNKHKMSSAMRSVPNLKTAAISNGRRWWIIPGKVSRWGLLAGSSRISWPSSRCLDNHASKWNLMVSLVPTFSIFNYRNIIHTRTRSLSHALALVTSVQVMFKFLRRWSLHSNTPTHCIVVIFWKIKGKIIRTVQCCIVYTIVHSHPHTQISISHRYNRAGCWHMLFRVKTYTGTMNVDQHIQHFQ